MKIALVLRILVMKTFVNVDLMHNGVGRPIRVMKVDANVVRMMNAQKHNSVILANAIKVRHC